ncbi:SDR family oxidoreductase [soil metagenome]
MKIDLSNSSVLVTGASRGIGRAVAERLASAGARVGVHYHRNAEGAERLAQGLGRGALPFGADLGDAAACQRLFAEALAAFGRIDVLVNNAGVAILSPLEAPLDDWVCDWDRTQAVNLRAAGVLCREAVRHFLDIGGGRIVNIASRAAFRGDSVDFLAYAASKGGMVALSRSIARGYGKRGVKAFVVAPGFVRTDMAQDFIDQYGEGIAVGDLALNELTVPADVAPTVVFLASGLADHTTGCTVDVNAGSYVH